MGEANGGQTQYSPKETSRTPAMNNDCSFLGLGSFRKKASHGYSGSFCKICIAVVGASRLMSAMLRWDVREDKFFTPIFIMTRPTKHLVANSF
jgi:hypothetical protein